ncbi:protein kinase domain-containing protein [Microbispora triticiradicis]|uniref:serine/threonine protein kinase n=1 Tax=Microbispora triticiradicis TaxID=2200763 RepID=UPI001AD7EC67|nr:protein kinase [Microbispora triticiradicis]
MVALEAGDPARLGPFTLVDRLGEGGQGVVFLGHGPQGEQVAVKLLHTRLTADPEARERFLREVALAQRVAPFCTAPVLHADLAGNQPYIVSEFVPGPSLRQLVDREGPRRGAALERLAISTATALAAIHRAGITHRDFKPANVLMGPEGPVVIDFGVARAFDSPQATATGASIGTPAYLAPEVLSGGTAGAPADMFAWGVTMVFAATGRPAFGADSIPSVITRILRDEPDLGDLAAPLRDIVAACLSKDPAPRPSAQDVVSRLTGQAHLTPPPPPLPPARAAAPPGHVTVPAAARRPRRTVLTWTAAGIGVPALVAAAFLAPSWVSLRAAGSETTATEAPGQAASAPAEPPIPPPSDLATPSGHRTGSPSPGSATLRPGSRPDARPGATAKPAASPAHGRRARPSPTATGPAAQPTEAPPTAKASPAPTKATATPKPSPTAKATPTKTAAPKPNPYTAKGVCGTGFAVVDSHSYGGQATTYLLYNASTGRNCVITLSRYTMPAKIRMSVVLKVKGGASAADAGAYTVYAGPLRLPAKGRCVIWGGGYGGASWSSAWSHCG